MIAAYGWCAEDDIVQAVICCDQCGCGVVMGYCTPGSREPHPQDWPKIWEYLNSDWCRIYGVFRDDQHICRQCALMCDPRYMYTQKDISAKIASDYVTEEEQEQFPWAK